MDKVNLETCECCDYFDSEFFELDFEEEEVNCTNSKSKYYNTLVRYDFTCKYFMNYDKDPL